MDCRCRSAWCSSHHDSLLFLSFPLKSGPMSRPYFFTWVDEPLLAACAWPEGAEQLGWLRGEGVDILITLTEEELPRSWIHVAGLMGVHVPVADMDTPSIEQIEQVMSVIDKAKASKM